MKNLLAIVFMAFVFASCEGPMGPPGLPGENGGITYWIVDKDIQVRSSDWVLSSNEFGDPIYIYEYRINDKDFNTYLDAYGEGLLTCYMYLDYYDKNLQAQTVLPNTIYQKDNANNLWQEHYSAEYTLDGFIIFKVTISDFFVDQRPPETHFKAVITY